MIRDFVSIVLTFFFKDPTRNVEWTFSIGFDWLLQKLTLGIGWMCKSFTEEMVPGHRGRESQRVTAGSSPARVPALSCRELWDANYAPEGSQPKVGN